MSTPACWLNALVLVAATATASCLPADTRPPPASLLLSVVADEPLPITTADGWTIAFDRLVVGVGNASLEDGCIQYSEGRYDRLLDARLVGEQKLSVLFGLGHCILRYRLAGPSGDTLLGSGVSAADRVLMGTPATDAYSMTPERVALDVAATAERGTERARLHWLVRRAVRYRGCGTTSGMAGDDDPRPIEFASGGSLSLHIVFKPEELFRDDARGGQLRFDPIVAADLRFGDGDGEITLDELDHESIAEARVSGPYGLGLDESHKPEAPEDLARVQSLGDYAMVVLLPRIAQFREPLRCSVLLPDLPAPP